MRDKRKRRSHFTDDERHRIVVEGAATTPKKISKEYGISLSTFYRWRARLLSRNRAQEAARLRDLERENKRLKTQVAELWLDYTSLRTALISNTEKEC
jgi:transposase-like protein